MDKGYRRVRPLEGGIEAWIEAGYETAVYGSVT
jgi:rhodanese-related sulfurtransferase